MDQGRLFTPIDDVFRVIDEVRERHLSRPVPYVVPDMKDIPDDVGQDAIPCPILDCDEGRPTTWSLRHHLEKAHDCYVRNDIEKLNRRINRDQTKRRLMAPARAGDGHRREGEAG